MIHDAWREVIVQANGLTPVQTFMYRIRVTFISGVKVRAPEAKFESCRKLLIVNRIFR